MRSGRGAAANHEFIRARDRAAHDGDLEFDQALIRLRYLSVEEIVFCGERYGVDTELYVGSKDPTEVYNIHACVETELLLQNELRKELEGFFARFQKLEASCGSIAPHLYEVMRATIRSGKVLRPILTLFHPSSRR